MASGCFVARFKADVSRGLKPAQAFGAVLFGGGEAMGAREAVLSTSPESLSLHDRK